MENLERIISGIVIIIFGIIFVVYRTRFSKLILDSELYFWKFFGKERAIGKVYEVFVNTFVLILGFLFFIFGFFQIFQSLR